MPKQSKPNLTSVTTINQDGSRYFLHPADVSGFWTRIRTLIGWLLIGVYVALPWIPVNGYPVVFLDVENRLFHLFGLTLVPQDMWVMFFAVTGMGFALFFITSLLGRVWCGWACPYTVFLDHIYRRIERWIDGDAQARRQLDAAPWTATKILKRSFKHLLFAGISALIAHVFLSYFVSLPRLYRFMHEGPLQHATAFGIIVFLTLVLWFCFGYFREQFCIIMCPYGRLQSALTDSDTVIVGYDANRGEPRGQLGRTTGACVDCHRCVQVCPTGIDIRDGLQLECLGCTACIDACDDIMTKVGQPTGLIRYDSQNGFDGKPKRILRPRIYAYSVLALLGLLAMTIVAWIKMTPYTISLSRVGQVGFAIDADAVSNIYLLRVQNKRNQPATLTVSLAADSPTGYQLSGGEQSFTIEALGELTRTCVIFAPLASYHGTGDISLLIQANPGNVTLKKSTRFLGPNPNTVTPAPR
ncbi:MAG: cytochrome c oxidase accessory protein CcoG [Verrucomicrobia bacterium]|nr:MAG: cytochrome c oxidase accessory protein CcoG [Verrucomicrobiota bacterium]